MKKQIVHVSVLQTSKVFAILYLVVSLPLILLSVLFSPLGSYSPLMLIAVPFLYALFGFLFTMFGAWIYNRVAKAVGGIEFTTVDVGQ